MLLKDVYQKLATLEDPNEKREALLDGVELIAQEIAGPLGLMADEVAVQAVVSDDSSLRFLFPRVLYQSGATFPIGRNSIAGLAVMMQKLQINNEVSSDKHLLFFEKLNTGVRAPLPIHKMATIPIKGSDKILGVVQLSRRAETFDAAGPDFSESDVQAIREPLMLISALLEDHCYGKI